MAEMDCISRAESHIGGCSSAALLAWLQGLIEDEAAMMDDVLSLSHSGRTLFAEEAPQAAAMFSMIDRVLEDGQKRALIVGILGELGKRLEAGVPA